MTKKLIATAGTEFAQNLAQFAIIDNKNRAGKPQMLDAATLQQAFENASADDREAFKEILTFDLEGEERTVTPTTSQQVITPSQGKNAITKCTVNGVTSSIDSNIIADNIKKDITILGVTGTLTGANELHEWTTGEYSKVYINCNPTLTEQEYQTIASLDAEGEGDEEVYLAFSGQDGVIYCSIEVSSDACRFYFKVMPINATSSTDLKKIADIEVYSDGETIEYNRISDCVSRDNTEALHKTTETLSPVAQIAAKMLLVNDDDLIES